jgi:hypothetical protein
VVTAGTVILLVLGTVWFAAGRMQRRFSQPFSPNTL